MLEATGTATITSYRFQGCTRGQNYKINNSEDPNNGHLKILIRSHSIKDKATTSYVTDFDGPEFETVLWIAI